MNKLLNRAMQCLVLILFFASSSIAQKPQYEKKQIPFVAVRYYCTFNPTQDTTPPRRFQDIYPTKFFPTAPRGYIKAVYFRSSVNLGGRTDQPGYAYNVIISLGWTAKDTFRNLYPTNSNKRDTFLTGATPIFRSSVVRQNLKDSGGRWMRFPVTENSFLYDTAQKGRNMFVDFEFGPPFVNNYFCLFDSAGGGAQQQIIGYRDTPSVYTTFRDPIVGVGGSIDFGFDLTPVGVEAGEFGGSFSLFPNPSKGSFHINVDGEKPFQALAITVRSITGQSIFKQQYSPASPNFSTDIHLPDAAKGIYFVEMIADGQRVVQRVLVE